MQKHIFMQLEACVKAPVQAVKCVDAPPNRSAQSYDKGYRPGLSGTRRATTKKGEARELGPNMCIGGSYRMRIQDTE